MTTIPLFHGFYDGFHWYWFYLITSTKEMKTRILWNWFIMFQTIFIWSVFEWYASDDYIRNTQHSFCNFKKYLNRWQRPKRNIEYIFRYSISILNVEKLNQVTFEQIGDLQSSGTKNWFSLALQNFNKFSLE